MANIFADIPADLTQEVLQDIVVSDQVKIERIISKGHVSPAKGWYDCPQPEWVIVLQGQGTLLFEDGREVVLKVGDYINIPAHMRHKVSQTDREGITIWLAIYY
ncbi:cupin domain-containing protein [Motilimonas pumila]|uniref:Cupin domain-containing protein n=1 Tax=Motilimonas pumila TaxID=2303987 RepID=A0A418YBX7_9GAMM|nr:cupin domain-containing protein [Motilimonas pumila]RJG42031.1 cupin domain-containing protein [Motilimonas pumila]